MGLIDIFLILVISILLLIAVVICRVLIALALYPNADMYKVDPFEEKFKSIL